MFCLQAKEVETARGESPSGAKSAVKEEASAMRGRSSATTTRVRTQPSCTPRDLSWDTDPPRPRVHSSITPEISGVGSKSTVTQSCSSAYI